MNYVIIIPDLHLGKGVAIGKAGLGATLNSRIVDQINLLDFCLDKAIESFAKDLILTGDIFEETKPSPALITIFFSWLKKCRAHDVNVHLIMGNHDLFRSGSVFSSSLDIISEIDFDNVFVYKDINTIIIGSSAFTLLPYRDRRSFNTQSNAEAITILKDSLVYELAMIPLTYKKVLVGHLAIEGSIPVGDEIDDIANELFCPLDMFNGYDYVWMGHVHKPQIMKKKNPYIAHIGSMDISNFGETDHKKFIIIIDCDSNQYSTEYLPTRPLKKISVSVPKDTDDTTSYVINFIKNEKDDYKKAIIKVEVMLLDSDLKSINKSHIEKYLIEQGAFNIVGISEAKKASIIKKDINNTIDTKMDVFSAIKIYGQTYVDAPVRDSFIELALDIYNTFKMETKE